MAIGLLSIAAGIAYTGGPYPLAYNGLGDLFVLIFFGGVATIGTYYVQAQEVSLLAVLAAIPAGALITNILVVNNYRDIESDREAGKLTLAVIIGEAGSRLEYLFFNGVSYLVPLIFFLFFDFSLWVLLPLLSVPLALKNMRMLYSGMSGKPLNKLLASTARLCLIYGLLFSAGIIL
ncbi:MAG: 1,4-dihydroxy-2-naphthoate octaprenyltransferase [Candidatus Marinimicrobia bacterium]|nr:1,4-dihydroxy-2-naphthoate octaprenyltransferase [Candidatus Neomarinimicrobiota bacterium]